MHAVSFIYQSPNETSSMPQDMTNCHISDQIICNGRRFQGKIKKSSQLEKCIWAVKVVVYALRAVSY